MSEIVKIEYMCSYCGKKSKLLFKADLCPGNVPADKVINHIYGELTEN